jgi:pectinesterase
MVYRFLLLLLSAAISACSSTHAPVAANPYTPETTYLKEVGNFPAIRVASRDLPEGVAEFKNLTYVSYGRRSLQLDLYAPATTMDESRPAIVLVHGGGWRYGERENLTALAQLLVLRGYVTATISYRLADEAKYPAAIHDVKAALRWMRVNAKTYGIDPDKIAVGGGSAGGQIASLVGMTNDMPEFDSQASSSLFSSNAQVIINIDGLSDFTSAEARKHEDDPAKNPSAAGFWFGGNYQEKAALWHQASPITYVRRGMPPMLFINSSRARFGVGRDEMIAKMELLAVPHHVEKFPDSPHGFWLLVPWVKPTAKIMADFLDVQFRYRATCH